MAVHLENLREHTLQSPPAQSGIHLSFSRDGINWSTPQQLWADHTLGIAGRAISWKSSIVWDDETDDRLEFPDRDISPSEIGAEHGRLDDAVEQSHRVLKQAEQPTSGPTAPTDSAAVLAAHAHLVHEIAAQVKQYMGRELVNVEQALDSVIGTLVDRLCQLENVYLREREQDICDVGRRMMRHLTGAPHFSQFALPAHAVIVARELMPSEAVELCRASPGV